MNQIEGNTYTAVRFDGDYQAGPLSLAGCIFRACALQPDAQTARLLRISDLSVSSCRFEGGHARGVWFRDCSFDQPSFVSWPDITGCVFERVKISGKVRQLLINDVCSFTVYEQQFQDSISLAYREIDWALDISELSCPSLDIRGIPSRLMRLNPCEHFVVDRKIVGQSDWREIDYTGTSYGIALRMLARSPWEDVILTLPSGKKRERAMEVIDVMARRGMLNATDPTDGPVLGDS